MASEAAARPVARTVVRQTCRVLLVYLSSTSCGPCYRGLVAWLDCAGLDGGLAVERRSSAVVPRRADLARQVVRAGLRLLRGSPVSGWYEVRRLIMTATPDAADLDAPGWEIPADDVADEEVDVLCLAGQRPPGEGAWLWVTTAEARRGGEFTALFQRPDRHAYFVATPDSRTRGPSACQSSNLYAELRQLRPRRSLSRRAEHPDTHAPRQPRRAQCLRHIGGSTRCCS